MRRCCRAFCGRCLGPPKKLYWRLYDSIRLGTVLEIVEAYKWFVAHNKHMKFDHYYRRCLWLETVVHGRHRLVHIGIEECPRRDKLFPPSVINMALVICCSLDFPSLNVVRVLVETGGADVNFQFDRVELFGVKRANSKRLREQRYIKNVVAGDTALIACCRKRHVENRERNSTIIQIIAYLRQRGADPRLCNDLGHDALFTALETQYFRATFQFANWLDPNLLKTMRYMRQDETRASNWVACAMLAAFAFRNAGFIVRLEDACASWLERWSTLREAQLKTDSEAEYYRRTRRTSEATTRASEVTVVDNTEVGETQVGGDGASEGGADDALPSDKSDDDESSLRADASASGPSNGQQDFATDAQELEELPGALQTPAGAATTATTASDTASTDSSAGTAADPASPVDASDEPNINERPIFKKFTSITGEDLVPFIAFIMIDAAERGLMPNNSFTKQMHPTLSSALREMQDTEAVASFLRKECSPLLASLMSDQLLRFRRMVAQDDLSRSRLYFPELYGIVRSVYRQMWKAAIPDQPGADEFMPDEMAAEVLKYNYAGASHYMDQLEERAAVERLDLLPKNWHAQLNPDGTVFYVNSQSCQTSRTRPRTDGRSFA